MKGMTKMKKYLNLYIDIVVVLFCSMIINNVREAHSILSLLHPYNLCLICLVIASLYVIVQINKASKDDK